jgi:hypothetical protein
MEVLIGIIRPSFSNGVTYAGVELSDLDLKGNNLWLLTKTESI